MQLIKIVSFFLLKFWNQGFLPSWFKIDFYWLHYTVRYFPIYYIWILKYLASGCNPHLSHLDTEKNIFQEKF